MTEAKSKTSLEKLLASRDKLMDEIAQIDRQFEQLNGLREKREAIKTQVSELWAQILSIRSEDLPEEEDEQQPAKKGHRGRPKGSKGGGRRIAGQKSLDDTIVEVLAKHKNGMVMKDLPAAILKSGYKTTAKPSSFTVACYSSVSRLKGKNRISKDGEGNIKVRKTA